MTNIVAIRERKKGGGSAPPSAPPCKGTSALDPLMLRVVPWFFWFIVRPKRSAIEPLIFILLVINFIVERGRNH
ncbi:MAG: hypothetical protein HQL02_00900 [Nitrospirae bacterium]|nr:hypothetical protein [Nitrospirota bacterium]